jgi:ArsR family transcriptional regulator, arsenate/arsenite/antimonite-responsive transcriptional repressor
MRLATLPQRRKNQACHVGIEAPSLSGEEVATLATRLKILSDPTRLELLDFLAQQREPLCVCDLTPRFSQNQPTISHHLKVLREAGLIDTEKRGLWSHYWATSCGKVALRSVTALL